MKPTVALGTTVTNQATIWYDANVDGVNEATALTDDPGVGGANDPTTFIVTSPALRFNTLTPCRLFDTRNAPGTYSRPALAAGQDRVFPLFGRCGIPSTAQALAVNVTVTAPTTIGNLRLYPGGTALPNASVINYRTGQTRANNAVLPLNGAGELAVHCDQSSGWVHVLVDVNGYFESSG